jgi:hypothetical protein
MSIVRSPVLDSQPNPYSDAPKDCLICGRRLEPPFLYWACTHPLAFHPNCFYHVALGLLRDVREFKFGPGASKRVEN